jgi:hypothetical protein
MRTTCTITLLDAIHRVPENTALERSTTPLRRRGHAATVDCAGGRPRGLRISGRSSDRMFRRGERDCPEPSPPTPDVHAIPTQLRVPVGRASATPRATARPPPPTAHGGRSAPVPDRADDRARQPPQREGDRTLRDAGRTNRHDPDPGCGRGWSARHGHGGRTAPRQLMEAPVQRELGEQAPGRNSSTARSSACAAARPAGSPRRRASRCRDAPGRPAASSLRSQRHGPGGHPSSA